jgi:hypothetical protein
MLWGSTCPQRSRPRAERVRTPGLGRPSHLPGLDVRGQDVLDAASTPQRLVVPRPRSEVSRPQCPLQVPYLAHQQSMRPDRWDKIGAVICLFGVVVIMYSHTDDEHADHR